jgi:NAD(P)-dependent dehydrogenase (short-subunit alcohol dehydrogenase family)
MSTRRASAEKETMPSNATRRVVLTGVTRGLGRALAEKLIALGHTVLGCGRNGRHIADLAAAFAAPHEFATVDVADDAGVRAWADGVLARHGAPDLLLNNAALINANAPLWQVPAEEFDRLIDVNVKGVANVIRAFVPAMIRRGTGVIVNFSSGWGRTTSPEVAPYCASKWAIEGLTRALAQELPTGLAAVPLNPGVIDTDMLRSSFGADAGSYPAPARWAEKAVPFLLGLGPRHNGQALTAPG